jgi:hypothetical protein
MQFTLCFLAVSLVFLATTQANNDCKYSLNLTFDNARIRKRDTEKAIFYVGNFDAKHLNHLLKIYIEG